MISITEDITFENGSSLILGRISVMVVLMLFIIFGSMNAILLKFHFQNEYIGRTGITQNFNTSNKVLL